MANMMINYKQCTTCWYVDATKISHIEPKIFDQILSKIEERFGKTIVTHGKEHNVVGMDLEFKESRKMKIYMKEYIKECTVAFREEISKGAKAPAKHNPV